MQSEGVRCRGCWELGNNCGECAHCFATAKDGVALIKRLRDEVERLRNMNGEAELRAAGLGAPLRPSRKIVAEWFAARNVIARFLRERCPALSSDEIDNGAAALIARLASHDPPILLEMADGRVSPV